MAKTYAAALPVFVFIQLLSVFLVMPIESWSQELAVMIEFDSLRALSFPVREHSVVEVNAVKGLSGVGWVRRRGDN